MKTAASQIVGIYFLGLFVLIPSFWTTDTNGYGVCVKTPKSVLLFLQQEQESGSPLEKFRKNVVEIPAAFCGHRSGFKGGSPQMTALPNLLV
ncbi:hypothetical protein COCON_G00113790 [Conger conger]|uniref:Uncharacterized protein n=1 Tax=Conger conger TaxID=82655 RepID=A0A9Q1DFH0_CONCO|nr:hypothetical protein COCON_G00113790 [Conger conger]